MKKTHFLVIAFYIFTTLTFAQSYPPQAGFQGTTAIHRNDPIFIAWATGCSVIRGPIKITDPDSLVSFGVPENAVGSMAGSGNLNVVSLGDGGSATLTFANPIKNGPGPDFAVFENGFQSGGPEEAFLELAFVEVSSDGQIFVRFPAVNEYTTPQLGGFATMNARYLHNLAGKYTANYGTPFDLDDLIDNPQINVDSITHIRIVDVIGNIDPQYATYDSQGNPVNDPWPTPFYQGGFDLGGVGVINERIETKIELTLCNETLPYIWNGQTISQQGRYTHVEPSSKGNDSTVILDLIVPPTNYEINTSICETDLPYTWNGQTITQTGTYTHDESSSIGCDSTTTLNLTVNPIKFVAIDSTINENELPITWNGQTITQAGTYTHIAPASNGCDSTITLNLTVTTNVGNVGVDKINNLSVKVYPNPVSEKLTIIVEEEAIMQLINTKGEMVIEETINGKASIDIGNCSTGLYILSVINKYGIYKQKISVR